MCVRVCNGESVCEFKRVLCSYMCVFVFVCKRESKCVCVCVCFKECCVAMHQLSIKRFVPSDRGNISVADSDLFYINFIYF